MVVVVVLAGCGGDDAAPSTTTSPYTAEVRADFVGDCLASGAEEAVCGCMFDRVAAEFPFERFAAFDRALSGNPGVTLPGELVAIAEDCAG